MTRATIPRRQAVPPTPALDKVEGAVAAAPARSIVSPLDRDRQTCPRCGRRRGIARIGKGRYRCTWDANCSKEWTAK